MLKHKENHSCLAKTRMVTVEAAKKVLNFRVSSEKNTPKIVPSKLSGNIPSAGWFYSPAKMFCMGQLKSSAKKIGDVVSAISLNFRPFLSHISNVSLPISGPS